MCYRVHEPERRPDHVTQVPVPPERPSFIRPRVVGAAAAALVALAATAAMLLPASTPAVPSDQAAAATTVSKLDTPDRAGPVIEQTATTMDDGVPSAGTDVATVRSSPGHCEHGL
jgi:hypothetical protein